MLGLFGDVSLFLKFDTVCIDNHVFKLHYKVRSVIWAFFQLFIHKTTTDKLVRAKLSYLRVDFYLKIK